MGITDRHFPHPSWLSSSKNTLLPSWSLEFLQRHSIFMLFWGLCIVSSVSGRRRACGFFVGHLAAFTRKCLILMNSPCYFLQRLGLWYSIKEKKKVMKHKVICTCSSALNSMKFIVLHLTFRSVILQWARFCEEGWWAISRFYIFSFSLDVWLVQHLIGRPYFFLWYCFAPLPRNRVYF